MPQRPSQTRSQIGTIAVSNVALPSLAKDQTRDDVAAALLDFDEAAWTNMVETQRILIARAAGVKPSKVRINICH